MNIDSLFLMIKLMWRYRCLCYEWRLKRIKYLINKIDLRSSLAAHTHFWSRGISFKRPSGEQQQRDVLKPDAVPLIFKRPSAWYFETLMLFLWSSTATQSEYISGKCPSISFRNILWYVFLRLELMFVVTMVEALSWRQKICEKWRDFYLSLNFLCLFSHFYWYCSFTFYHFTKLWKTICYRFYSFIILFKNSF